MTTTRTLSVIAGATVAGCIGGGAVALLQATSYRATTTLLVQVRGAPAAVPTVAALATGDSVIGNVASATRLTPGTVRDHLHVSRLAGTALVRLAYDDANRLKAGQVVQEEATVVEAIVADRLGSTVRASIVDPAHTTRLAPPLGADALVGASIGLLLGAAGVGVARTRSRPAPSIEPAVAQAAPPVQQQPPPPTVPQPDVPPPPPVPPSPPPPRSRVAELRQLVAQRGAEHSADQLAEWHGYLEAFAQQEVDGELPPGLELLARDVFAPLLERA